MAAAGATKSPSTEPPMLGEWRCLNLKNDGEGEIKLVTPEEKKAKIKELETAIERFYLGAFKIDGNHLHANVTLYSNMAEQKYDIVVGFKLNDEDHVMRISPCMHEINEPKDLVFLVRDRLCEKFAEIISMEFLDKNRTTLMNIAKDKFS